MGEIGFSLRIDTLGPNEPREIVHTVDGTPIRAEILEANTRHYKAQIRAPFEQTISRELPLYVLSCTPFGFVRDGRITAFMMDLLKAQMYRAFDEWRRKRQARTHFLAYRKVIEPLILAAHQEVAEACTLREAIVEKMRSLGKILESELLQHRRVLKQHFKQGLLDQTGFQTRLKQLRKRGPETEAAASILAAGKLLQSRFQALRERHRDCERQFTHQTGLQLEEAFGFLHLTTLPFNASMWQDPVDQLDFSGDVRSLLRADFASV